MHVPRLIELARDLELTTARLVIRRMQERDRATAIAHEEDRRIMRWIRDPLPRAEIEERVQQTFEPWDGADGRWLVLTIADRGTDRMLGIACCRVTLAEHETLEIGYRLHPDHHRRGLAFEAMTRLVDFLFEEGEARRILALCDGRNEASWRLMEKLGMRREAELREHSRLGGAWCDELVYGLLRRDWAAARPEK
ncbi:MAG: GNAT family N-acetyltransferase [Planctomycetota bacterium]